MPLASSSRARSRASVVVFSVLLMLATAQSCLAEAPVKKTVTTLDDLPRFTYPIEGTASALLTSDDATFGAFSDQVHRDVDEILANFDVQDRATLRSILGVRLALEILARNEDQAALQTIARIQSLEDKPDAKLLSGYRSLAIIKARTATGKSSGPEFERAYAEALNANLNPLPWAVVGNRVKEARMSAQVVSPNLIIGNVEADVEPTVTKAHRISRDLAWEMITMRLNLKEVVPLKAQTLAVLSADVAANNVQRADIWAAREVTLAATAKLTPVVVGIWDSGSDLTLFPGQTFEDEHPTGMANRHGLAFDMMGFPVHGDLYPITPEQAALYPTYRDDFNGISDLQLAIDSPESDALKHQFATMSPPQVAQFFENMELFIEFAHGTHVASIAVRGNPAARIAVVRKDEDWHNVPHKPTADIVARTVSNYQTTVDWFRGHGVRVVNMSWGVRPADYEGPLEKNGVGSDERKSLARQYFTIDRDGLYAAIKSAPDVLFICAAGNADVNSSFDETVPASFKLPNLLTVGAVDQAGDEASFTSYGDTVRVDANGYQVESLVPGGAKVRFSGTSMASPNTVNLAAKLLALHPKLTPPELIRLIVQGSTPSPDGRRHNIDPKRSIDMAEQGTAGT